ncbi:MAG: hypothetical protein ACI4QY_07050, partial [Oscillospiraceae bacterium]
AAKESKPAPAAKESKPAPTAKESNPAPMAKESKPAPEQNKAPKPLVKTDEDIPYSSAKVVSKATMTPVNYTVPLDKDKY